jgi:hypothetical protein
MNHKRLSISIFAVSCLVAGRLLEPALAPETLVDKKPELALSYVSVKANACIAAFSGESTPGSDGK